MRTGAMAKKDLDQRHKRLLARLAMGMCGLCGLQMWDMLTMTREAHEFQRLPHPRAFIGNVMADTPDLSGDRRQKAAKRLAEAKEVLDEALELKAAGVSGKGLWYRVITEGEDGIGIRKAPRMDGPRVEDLVRGSVFEVDKLIQKEGQPIWLHLDDGRGWVFDLTPVDSDTPTVERIQGAYEYGRTIEELEADVEAARLELDRIRGAKRGAS
ncbi:unnamed protein product [Cladocopium goreaui]|uniref:Uncharacterized protein n=1 Tax=Cladocopium goreaui TaxID=2562237 RepID=A0A9P1D091_9DINO|nr:unnamed protein product [Cladocopium goreaui]|mmetsp:Transcript_73384/g.162084  ORF Transcript_73384/g.162084 Transcript_73384/m.162084 type:complete len:212 (-) Transcript_73384:61-696(-)